MNDASSQSLVPTTGVMRGQVHVFPIRVYYEDTDAGGIVYYANYLKFAERGRTEMLRTLGIEQHRLREESGMQFVVHAGEVNYSRSAKLDDVLLVETSLIELGGTKVVMRQAVKRPASGNEEIASFQARVVCVGMNGRPTRIPDQVRDVLQGYITPSET